MSGQCYNEHEDPFFSCILMFSLRRRKALKLPSFKTAEQSLLYVLRPELSEQCYEITQIIPWSKLLQLL